MNRKSEVTFVGYGVCMDPPCGCGGARVLLGELAWFSGYLTCLTCQATWEATVSLVPDPTATSDGGKGTR